MGTYRTALRVGGDGFLITRSGRRPAQNAREYAAFVDLLLQENVRRYLEIGARHGDALYDLMMSLPTGSMAVAVDLPGSLWGQKQSQQNLEAACDDLRSKGYDVHLLLANSQKRKTAEIVRTHGPFDAALIDGDHTYKGVSRDWSLYKDQARLIAFHDIVGEGQSTGRGQYKVEVPRLWQELKSQYRHVEFIDEGSKMGIGVLWVR